MPLPSWMIAQEAHPLPPLPGARLHVLGIGGRGMAPLAAAAASLGADVTGCDSAGGFPESESLLNAAGIAIERGQAPSHVDDGRLLVPTSSARGDLPEVTAARAAGRLHRRMDLTAAIAAARPGVGVTGSHGKGTVSALATSAALAAGLDPMAILGVHTPQLGGSFRAGSGPSILEVDDSDLAADFVACDVAVVTNLDDDHPHLDVSVGEAAGPIAGFVANARRRVILGPSPRRDALARHARAPVWRIGVDVRARVTGQREAGSVVRIIGPDGERVEALIRLVGPATATNAALAYAAARALGADAEAAAAGLASIDRLYRRLEPLGCHRGVWVYDDFGGKHPAAVRGGILALRRRHGGARIIAIFEPVFAAMIRRWGWRHARALKLADVAIVLPTVEHVDYPSTADPALAEWFREPGEPILGCGSAAEAARVAAGHARSGDVIVGFMQLATHGRELGAAVIDALCGPA